MRDEMSQMSLAADFDCNITTPPAGLVEHE